MGGLWSQPGQWYQLQSFQSGFSLHSFFCCLHLCSRLQFVCQTFTSVRVVVNRRMVSQQTPRQQTSAVWYLSLGPNMGWSQITVISKLLSKEVIRLRGKNVCSCFISSEWNIVYFVSPSENKRPTSTPPGGQLILLKWQPWWKVVVDISLPVYTQLFHSFFFFLIVVLETSNKTMGMKNLSQKTLLLLTYLSTI